MMTHTVKDDELMPTDWQNGDVAMSKTHFYMIYNNPKDGITVRWYNKVTNEADKHHNFKSADDAKTWVKDVHFEYVRARYDAIVRETGLDIGQKWLNKHSNHFIIEVVMIDGGFVYSRAYGHKPIVKREPSYLKNYLEKDFILMLNSETIEQALMRCEVTA